MRRAAGTVTGTCHPEEKTMHRLAQQDGKSTKTIFFGLVVAGVLLLFLFRLTPVYMEHFAVVSSLNSMEEEIGMRTKSLNELKRLLQNRFDINDVKRVTKDDVIIKRQGQSTLITVAYEVQIPLISNIDLLVSFDNTANLN
jgi:hypothetical protein